MNTNNSEIENLLNQATDQQQLEFLTMILNNDSSYLDMFKIEVIGQMAVEKDETIEDIRQNVKDEIESFDFSDYESYYGSYNPSNGYMDELDILYEGAMEDVEFSWDTLKDNVHYHLKTGNIIEAIKSLLGLYEGINTFDESRIIDPQNIFDHGLEYEFLELFENFLKKFADELQAISFNENVLIRIAKLFVERIQYYLSNPHYDFSYDLTKFGDILETIVSDKASAKFLLGSLKKLDLLDNSTAGLQLKISEILKNEDNWITSAESFFEENHKIGIQLMDFYFNRNDKKNFIRVAGSAISNYSDKVDEFIYQKLDRSLAPELFKKALCNFAKRTKNVLLFKELKEKFGEDVAKEFISGLKDLCQYKLYYLKLLEIGRDYPSILEFVKENVDDVDFNKLINPILTIYPAECFEIIKNKVDTFLLQNKGRENYKRVAGWLKLMFFLTDKKVGLLVQEYHKSLLIKFNRFPALKDELRKVGIQR